MSSPPLHRMVKFGTREFEILVIRALMEYLRHKPNIDSDLSPAIVAALGVLVDNIDIILLTNKPGPE